MRPSFIDMVEPVRSETVPLAALYQASSTCYLLPAHAATRSELTFEPEPQLWRPHHSPRHKIIRDGLVGYKAYAKARRPHTSALSYSERRKSQHIQRLQKSANNQGKQRIHWQTTWLFEESMVVRQPCLVLRPGCTALYTTLLPPGVLEALVGQVHGASPHVAYEPSI